MPLGTHVGKGCIQAGLEPGESAMDKEVIVIGSGLNGAAHAVALARAGISVALVEGRDMADFTAADFDGRAYALSLASKRMLDALGIWSQVASEAQPILDIKVADGRPGEGAGFGAVHFDHAEIEEGPMGWIVEDRIIRRALVEALARESKIEIIAPARVIDHEIRGAFVRAGLDDGRSIEGRLLVACDGRESPTARRAGIHRIRHDYHQTAIVCAVAHEHDHGGAAHQLFLPGGPFAILPLAGGKRSSIVWAEVPALAERLMKTDEADFLAALRPRFGDFLGEISLAGKRFAYPLALSLAERMVADRVALVGDAAHGIHPLAGQGFNLGLRDSAALAEVLVTARRRGEDIGSPLVLERYSAWRSFDNTATALAMSAIDLAFSNENPLLRLGRNLGLAALDRLPALKRRFIREAAGIASDLPRLLAGRPL